MKLSVVITSKNAAKTLERTLRSVKFADEIVVVDMNSSDETRAIASKFTKKIFCVDDAGYVEPARNYSLSKASGDWVLVIDADEVIPVTLKTYILKLIKSNPQASCFAIARKNFIFGDWVRTAGWWPDFQPRLFLRGHVKWSDEIHSKPKITGKSDNFPKRADLAIEHYNYETISQFVQRMDRYTTIASKDIRRQTISQDHLIREFHREFLQRLFLWRGLDGGYRGVLLSFLQGFSQVVQTAKLWELHHSATFATKSNALPALDEFRAQLAYWVADEHIREARGLTSLIWKIRRKLRF